MKITTSDGPQKFAALWFIMNWVWSWQASFQYSFAILLEKTKDETVVSRSHIQFESSSFIYWISTNNKIFATRTLCHY